MAPQPIKKDLPEITLKAFMLGCCLAALMADVSTVFRTVY